jgi:uncharacterized membrane protein HdeD (DUF308 family)
MTLTADPVLRRHDEAPETAPGNAPEHVRGAPAWAGLALMALGALALVFPFFTTLGATLAAGAILTASGVVMIVQAFSCKPAWRLALHALWGAVSLTVGIGMIVFPVSGAISLTIVLDMMFAEHGIVRLALALKRPQPRRWAWFAVSGLISIFLAALIAFAIPLIALTLPGVIIGVDLIFAGAALLAMRDVHPVGAPSSTR